MARVIQPITLFTNNYKTVTTMKNKVILLLVAALTLTNACKTTESQVEIHPIQTFPDLVMMPKAVFNAPDSLITELGIEKGVPTTTCAFLAKTEEYEILFDTGMGEVTELVEKLDSLGIKPEDIDHIFLTHLHGDHIGGLAADDKAVFPNAQLHINTVEYDAWMAKPAEKTESLQEKIGFYKDRLHIFTLEEKLPCGIQAIEAYGHTPGHTAYKIGNNIIAGDIMHGVALQAKYPEYCAPFDMDKEKAIETRKAIMETASKKGLRVYGMHFPEPYWL